MSEEWNKASYPVPFNDTRCILAQLPYDLEGVEFITAEIGRLVNAMITRQLRFSTTSQVEV